MIVNDQQQSYTAIAQSIQQQIYAKVYTEGEKLPSIRQLARLYSVNQKTIQRAIRELEVQHLLNTVPGVGVFVSQLAQDSTEQYKQSLLDDYQQIITNLKEGGLQKDVLYQYIDLIYERKEK